MIIEYVILNIVTFYYTNNSNPNIYIPNTKIFCRNTGGRYARSLIKNTFLPKQSRSVLIKFASNSKWETTCQLVSNVDCVL